MAEQDRKPKTLTALFPGVTEEQLKDIADTLHGYCATVWHIYERLEKEHPDLIDELMRNRTMKGKVDSHKPTH